jgi:hypothetical protein
MTTKSMRIGAFAATFMLMSGSALAAPTFINGLTIPGDAIDVSGDSGLGARLGFFSDLYFDPNRSEWWALADRGPGGGTLSYETRVERFNLDVNPVTGAISNFQVVQTVKFSDPGNLLGAGAGAKLNGIAPSPTNLLRNAFDPEGLVVNPKTGRFIVSDEYGPSVYEFNRDGTLNRVFTTPANLVPRNAGTGVPNFAGDTGNDAGKRTNRGFEGLAISPDGKYAYAMLQSAMLDEGGGSGVFNRIVKFDTETGLAVAQYGYKMEGSSQGRGISALVALNDTEFLVLERNNRGVGVDSELTPPNKKVFRIDITGATDISALDLTDNGTTLKPGIVLVTKTATPFLALDVASEQLAGLGNRVPEKLEGLTIGPRLDGGDYVIVSATDNDFSVTQDAGSGIQFDELFNPTTIERLRCPIGFAGISSNGDCTIVNANGSLGAAYVGSLAGYALVPGAMFAYRTTGTELAAYEAPMGVPAPASILVLGTAIGLAGAMRRLRRIPGDA